MNLRTKVTVALAAGALAAVSAFPALSGASPIDDKRRQAAELQRQIDANDHELVTLSERLNGARYRKEQSQVAIAEAEARTQAAIAERNRIRDILGKRAAQIYKGAGSSTPLSQMDVSNINEMSARSKYASAAADHDNVLIDKLVKAKEELDARKADLERQRAAAQAEEAAAASARTKVEAANRQNQALKSQVTGQIQVLLTQEANARAAAAQRAAAAGPPRTTTTGSGTARRAAVPTNFPNVPAPNAGAAAAVAFAKAQVGKGYRYATSGPDTFDCSGLTAAAWSRGGVGLAHYSGAQYQQTIRIGAGDLQPGDLVFYGPGGSNHVEIYIGGGMVVSASNPSSGVKMAGVRYGSAAGYGRPRLTTTADPGSPELRLTQFSHGAGCACKLSPDDLRTVLGLVRGLEPPTDPNLIVGLDTADDAAVYRVRDDLALVLTTDFFTPLVDDPYDWGRIAATNALSDVYAMGGAPLLALNLVAWPRDGLPFELLARVIDGGADVVRAAGAIVAGGHSIDDPEPKYGLAVVGTVEPDRVWRNVGGRAGDVLVLTKPIGLGVITTAVKRDGASAQQLATAVDVMTTLNAAARDAGRTLGDAVHAATDVTGFGLMGHLGELARGSGVGARVERASVPVIDGVPDLIRDGFVAGGTQRNHAFVSSFVDWGDATEHDQLLLADAQTSGGLLFAVDPDAAGALVAALESAGTPAAARIGSLTADAAGTIAVL